MKHLQAIAVSVVRGTSHTALVVPAFLALSLALSCAASGQEAKEAPASAENAAIDDALRSLGMTRADLEVNRDRAASEWKSAVVLNLLGNPLGAQGYCRKLSASVAGASSDGELIRKSVEVLGTGPLGTVLAEAPEGRELETADYWKRLIESLGPGATADLSGKTAAILEMPLSARKALGLVLFHLNLARMDAARAFESMSAEERECLRTCAPALMIPADGRVAEFKVPAYPGMPPSPDAHAIARALALAKKARPGMLASTAWMISEMLRKASALFKSAGLPRDFEFRLETGIGLLVVSGAGPDVHMSGDFIIDLGGDDFYAGERFAGCAGDPGRPVSFVLDLGGSDTYRCSGDFALGGALMGAAVLRDEGGDDFYQGRDGSQGAGLFGTGILYDGGGCDVHGGGDFCQGAGCFGIGILFADQPEGARSDADGADRYSGAGFCQGFSRTGGFGLLFDRHGADVYVSGDRDMYRPLYADRYHSLSQGFSVGVREYGAAGSIAMLVDAAGCDRYLGGVHCQGAGCWFGAGFLADMGGSDFYSAAFDAQGAAVHSACGVLLDDAGDDFYTLADGLGQGCSHDYSVGILVDRAGNDKYATRSAAQGVGLTNGFGMLLDAAGDDSYSGHSGHIQGAGRAHSGVYSIGLLADLGGRDAYGGVLRSGVILTSTGVGAGIDSGAEGADAEGKCDVITVPEPVLPEGYDYGPAKFDELFRKASAWNVGEARVDVAKARAEIAAWGGKAVEFLKIRMKEWDGLVIWALDSVFEALAAKHREPVERAILEALNGGEAVPLAHALRLSAKLRIAGAAPRLMQLMKADSRYWIHVFPAAGALRIRDAVPILIEAVKGEDDAAAIEALKALGKIADPSSLPQVLACFDSRLYPRRFAAGRAAACFGNAASDALWARATDRNSREPARICAIYALQRLPQAMKDAEFAKRLAAALSDESWAIRGHAAAAFASVPDALDPSGILKKAAETEKHPFVIGKIDESLSLLARPPSERKPKPVKSGVVDYPGYAGEEED